MREKFKDMLTDPEMDEGEAKKRKIMCIVMAAALFVLSLYIGGCIGILVNPKKNGWGFGFFHAVSTVFTTKAGRNGFLFIFLICMAFLAVMVLLSRTRDMEMEGGHIISRKDTYGGSYIQTEAEYSKFLQLTDSPEETDGIIVGKTLNGKKIVSIRRDDPRNRNKSVCGSQGTNKSIAIARNIIIQCAVRGESIICTDPKGELYGDSAYYLRQMGYEVRQWNLINRWNSDGLDILQQVNGEEEMEYIDVLCQTIIQNTKDGNDNSDDFFDKIEKLLLKALCLYVLLEMPEENRTISDVYGMLLKYDAPALDSLFAALPVGHAAKQAYNLFSLSPGNKGNAILGLGARMQIFQNKAICGLSSADEIDLEGIAKRKTAIFCIVSDRDTTYNVLNALFISLIFIKIMGYADRQPNRKCKVPVEFLLDELPNIGMIDGLKQKEGTARSRDIGITFMFQNIAQMQDRFEETGCDEIIGGCDFNMILGCNDTRTSKYYSEYTGTSTIRVDTTRKNLNTIRLTDFTPQIAQSEGEGQRATVMEDEIRRLQRDELLLFINGERPIKLKKFPFYEHPEALKMRAIAPVQVRPTWRVEDGIDKRTGKAPDGKELTFDEACAAEEKDDSTLVVKDSEKWGPQRTDLVKKYNKVKAKYQGAGVFPNGMEVFDPEKGNYVETAPKGNAEGDGTQSDFDPSAFRREVPQETTAEMEAAAPVVDAANTPFQENPEAGEPMDAAVDTSVDMDAPSTDMDSPSTDMDAPFTDMDAPFNDKDAPFNNTDVDTPDGGMGAPEAPAGEPEQGGTDGDDISIEDVLNQFL